MTEYDIVMIGHVSKDIMYFHDGHKDEFFGGPVVYSSASASISGSKVLVVTKAARNDIPDLEYLGDKSIDVEVIPSPETTSIKNVYLTANQERREVTLLAQADPFNLKEIPVKTTKIYHLAGLFSGELPTTLIEPLSKRGDVGLDAQGVLRCNEGGEMLFRDWNEKKKLLPYIKYLKTDAAEAQILTGSEDREEAARILADWGVREVMVTHHTEVLVLVDGTFYKAPFTPRNLSGRTGRGDTCFASYLSRRLQEGPEDAVRFSAALTSLKMEKPGRFNGTQEDVFARIG